jgi:hypothetical protein
MKICMNLIPLVARYNVLILNSACNNNRVAMAFSVMEGILESFNVETRNKL